MKNLKYILGSLIAVSVLLVSCEKEYDAPTVPIVPTGGVKTIAEVKAMYVPGEEFHITQDMSVFGVVTADETTGNLYKEAYMQDETGGLYLRFQSNSGLYIGDSIKVYLKGAKIIRYQSMLQIDSLDADDNIQKIATQKYRTPELVTIADLFNDKDGYEAKLIQLDSVYFDEGGVATYADGENQVSISRVLADYTSNVNNQVDVRTSGYANFANDILPGSGTFIGVVAQYSGSLQLVIRNPNELNMPYPSPFVKNFNDESVTSGGWVQQNVIGDVDWYTDAAGGAASPYAVIKNYNGSSNIPCETWLVSPTIDLSASSTPKMSMRSDVRYGGAPLVAYITTNYTGDVTTTSWTVLPISLDTDNFNWGFVSSGSYSLLSYANQNITIAFKYTGGSSDGSTWEIDDIKIFK
tara:strand:- start:11808 stop:13034 length:1227 start_codon:yes stop_codon:yes gene_type:complete